MVDEMSQNILLCTVGGSHQPVITAIRSINPDYVCFFCTDKDSVSGKKGSRSQVEDEKPDDKKPTLPNIPTQVGLVKSQFRVRCIPADDLDSAFLAIEQEIGILSREFPQARFIADYTGGTKTMSAALVCASLENSDVGLQLVTGPRHTLSQVETGSEQVYDASIIRLRTKRKMEACLRAWNHFGYYEAVKCLDTIQLQITSPERTHLYIARMLSRAFASWDDFDHVAALDSLKVKPCAEQVSRLWPWMLPTLGVLTARNNEKWEPFCLYDLWLNAERCARQGKYDDAVARVYRLIEWTAQWQLRCKCDINTADVCREDLPPNMVKEIREGKIKIGLWDSWQVAFYKVGGLKEKLSENELRNFLSIRNDSILAHGFKPVDRTDWDKMLDWMKREFLPMLHELIEEAGISNNLPEQLPQQFPQLML